MPSGSASVFFNTTHEPWPARPMKCPLFSKISSWASMRTRQGSFACAKLTNRAVYFSPGAEADGGDFFRNGAASGLHLLHEVRAVAKKCPGRQRRYHRWMEVLVAPLIALAAVILAARGRHRRFYLFFGGVACGGGGGGNSACKVLR